MNYLEGLKKILKETTTSYGGIWGSSTNIGDHGGDFSNSDWYATGDARNVFGYDLEDRITKNGKKRGKKKRKKNKKIHLYRRTFTEALTPDLDPILNCMLFVDEKYHDLVETILTKNDVPFTKTDSLFEFNDVDDNIQLQIQQITDILTEDVFSNNCLAFIGEMYDYVDLEDIKQDIVNANVQATELAYNFSNMAATEDKTLLKRCNCITNITMYAMVQYAEGDVSVITGVAIKVPNLSKEERIKYHKMGVATFADYSKSDRKSFLDVGENIADFVFAGSLNGRLIAGEEVDEIARFVQEHELGTDIF